jgi:hypothetical protein
MPVVPSPAALPSSAEHDIEAGEQLAPARRLLEGDDQGGPRQWIVHASQQAVAGVFRGAGDVHLGYQRRLAVRGDGEMDMRCAAGIGHRLDGAKTIAAVTAGGEPPIALKVGVQRALAAIARMVVAAKRVALPDFDAGSGQRLAAFIENAAVQIADLAARDAVLPSNVDQVVVVVERQLSRVERSQCLLRGAQQSRPGRGGERQPGD